jgi:small nuclear ribonucleoprotein (snRNP)-like protein
MNGYRKLTIALGAALVALTTPGWAQVQRAMRPPTQGGLEQIPESKPLEHDVVHLDNGDKVSGTLLRLDGTMLIVTGDLVGGEVRVPLEHVRLALFRTPDELPETPADRLVFPNGDRLSVAIDALADGHLTATTSAGGSVEVETERLAGIIFERKPHTVYENDFSSDQLKGLKPVSGDWAIEDGALVQKERNASFSVATLEVVQDGRFEYDWVADLTAGYTYGFYFFAENDQSVHGGTSYLVMAQGRSVYLYKVFNDNQQYYANYTLTKRDKQAKFHLDYNPGNGHIILTVDGEDVFRYRDPDPIASGRYVIVRVDNFGRFDDISIRRLGGGRILATQAKARGRDIVCLVNNDEVSGTVVAMDDQTVLMKTDYDEDPVDIQRDCVSSLTFYRQASRAAQPGSVRVTLVNDDVLTGRLVGLDPEQVVVDTGVVGQITLPRILVRELSLAGENGEAVGAILDDGPGAGDVNGPVVIRENQIREGGGRIVVRGNVVVNVDD